MSSASQRGSAKTLLIAAVAISAIAILGLSVIRGESTIEMLAKVITAMVVPLNAFILFGFAIITALVVGVFVNYYLVDLKEVQIIDKSSARRVVERLRTKEKPLDSRVGEAKRLLDNDETLFGSILRRFLCESGLTSERPGAVWQHVQDEEFERVKRNLMYLSLASVLAPAMGFLGTAVGMVSAFYEISIQDTVTPADLALSIQIALITTVIGLVIKTFAMLLKTMLLHSIGRREDQMLTTYQRLFEA